MKQVRERKGEYHILMHIYGLEKNGADELTFRAGAEMQRRRTDLCLEGGREEFREQL